MVRVPDITDMDAETFQLHLAKRHPGIVDDLAHSRDHWDRDQDHTHKASRRKLEKLRNHQKIAKTRGKASDYQCTLCFDPALDWAHLWRTHPDETDPESYVPMCRRDHMDYDFALRSAAMNRRWQNPGFRARHSASMSKAAKARNRDAEGYFC